MTIRQTEQFVGDWGPERTNLGKAEAILAAEADGTLWLGQGSMASDGIAEIDFSGRSAIAYSSIPDLAGGQFFLQRDRTLSDVTIGDVLANLDGSRRRRVRYDTPALVSFSLSGAYGRDVLTRGDERNYADVALMLGPDLRAVQAAGGVGYDWKGSDSQTLEGSVSALHLPTGLNLTIAAGGETQGGDGRHV